VLKVHKEIPIEEATAESVGLAMVKGSKSREIFVSTILSLIRNKEYINKFWLEIFNFLVDNGYVVKTVEIDKDDWREVDFHPDFETLRRLILEGFR
jgi:choline kinase